jgi:hypothetical protein
MSKAARHRAKFFGKRRLPVIGETKPDGCHPALDPRRSIAEAWAFFETVDSFAASTKLRRAARLEIMNFKISFTDGSWRIVAADVYSLDERLVVFLKSNEPVLTAVLANVLFFEPAAAETSHDVDRH